MSIEGAKVVRQCSTKADLSAGVHLVLWTAGQTLLVRSGTAPIPCGGWSGELGFEPAFSRGNRTPCRVRPSPPNIAYYALGFRKARRLITLGIRQKVLKPASREILSPAGTIQRNGLQWPDSWLGKG